MNIEPTAIKGRIMRRIYAIWFIRRAPSLIGELIGLVILIGWGLQHISPVNIATNAFSAADGVNAFAIFFVRAFNHLSAPSQFAIVAASILGVLIIRDAWLQVGRLTQVRNRMALTT